MAGLGVFEDTGDNDGPREAAKLPRKLVAFHHVEVQVAEELYTITIFVEEEGRSLEPML